MQGTEVAVEAAGIVIDLPKAGIDIEDSIEVAMPKLLSLSRSEDNASLQLLQLLQGTLQTSCMQGEAVKACW